MKSSGKWALAAACLVLATAVQAAFHGREIVRRPDMCNVDMIDTVSWYANESLRLAIEPWRCGERLPIPEGASALWVVADEGGTNWIVRFASTVTATNAVFELAAGEGALPAGHEYTGFVDLLQGTNVLGVIDRFEVACLTDAYGTSPITPAAGTWEGLASAVASNSAAIAAHSAALADLEGLLQGPAWLTPARFSFEAEQLTTTTTNIGEEVDKGWAVLTRERVVEKKSGYAVRPVIERNQWDATLETVVDGPATLSAVGDGSYTLAWDLGTETGSTATVSGQLGDWMESTTLTMKSAWGVVTQNWFSNFASGSVREDLAEVLNVWTNMVGSTNRFLNFSAAEKATLESLILIPDPNFWARNCDLSGVSAWNNDWKYTRNGTLISSNVIYCAGHWAPSVGRTLAWYGKDSQLHSSKVVDQRRLNFDLCVSKISPPLDTNVVTAYPILDLTEIDKKVKAGDGAVYGLPPMPVLAMAKRQAGFVMCSELTTYGWVGGIFDAAARSYISNSRSGGVSGDSGHPVFVSTDATNLVLFGCYWRPNVVSTPGADKDLVLSAIEAMGADTNAVVWEAWTNYPTYLGPLSTPN